MAKLNGSPTNIEELIREAEENDYSLAKIRKSRHPGTKKEGVA